MSFDISQIIVGLLTTLCTVIGVIAANNKNQAIIETKLEALTKQVEKHNNFASRIPVIEERVDVANHRIADLERQCEKCGNKGSK